jgi:CopG family nickel-responsive transcriptional regulator
MKTKLLCRFSISMAQDLVDQLDVMAKAKGYANRSQAVADMVRSHLVEYHGQTAAYEMAGTITLVYDHHKRNIQALLTDIRGDIPLSGQVHKSV